MGLVGPSKGLTRVEGYGGIQPPAYGLDHQQPATFVWDQECWQTVATGRMDVAEHTCK